MAKRIKWVGRDINDKNVRFYHGKLGKTRLMMSYFCCRDGPDPQGS